VTVVVAPPPQGTVGIDVSIGNLAGRAVQEQTQALSDCHTMLQAAATTPDDVVAVGMLLTNPTDFAGMNEQYTT
jgi:2-iminobutanoate/2-iminopropanoate deaminase